MGAGLFGIPDPGSGASGATEAGDYKGYGAGEISGYESPKYAFLENYTLPELPAPDVVANSDIILWAQVILAHIAIVMLQDRSEAKLRQKILNREILRKTLEKAEMQKAMSLISFGFNVEAGKVQMETGDAVITAGIVQFALGVAAMAVGVAGAFAGPVGSQVAQSVSGGLSSMSAGIGTIADGIQMVGSGASDIFKANAGYVDAMAQALSMEYDGQIGFLNNLYSEVSVEIQDLAGYFSTIMELMGALPTTYRA